MRRTRRRETGLERTLRLALIATGESFEPQKQFGRYCVDFYLPRLRVALEADGTRWHPQKEAARKSVWAMNRYKHGLLRDRILTNRHGLTVIHLRDDVFRHDLDGTLRRILQDTA